MAKNIFEKLHLVESQENETPDYSHLDNLGSTTSAEAVAVDVDTDQLVQVEDIYKSVGIDDLSKSIFKVDDFKKALPESLPSELKKSSVINIISISGLKVEDLIADSANRVNVLTGALQEFSQKTIDEVTSSQNEISELEKKVDELKKAIIERQKLQEEEEKLLNAEMQNISDITNFIK